MGIIKIGGATEVESSVQYRVLHRIGCCEHSMAVAEITYMAGI